MFGFPRVPQRQGVRNGLRHQEHDAREAPEPERRALWASRAGKVMMAAAPRFGGGLRGSAVGFVVARAASRLGLGSDKGL